MCEGICPICCSRAASAPCPIPSSSPVSVHTSRTLASFPTDPHSRRTASPLLPSRCTLSCSQPPPLHLRPALPSLPASSLLPSAAAVSIGAADAPGAVVQSVLPASGWSTIGERWPAFHSLHLAPFYLYAEAEDNQDRLPAGPDQWVRRPVSRLMADPNGKASVAYWFRFGLKGSPGLRSLWDMNVNVVLKLESPTDDFARPILQFTYQD